MHWCRDSSQACLHWSEDLRAFLAWTLSQQFPSLTTPGPWDRWLISFIADMSGRKCGWISSENRICRQTSWQTWWQSSTTWRTAAIWCLQRPWPWGRWKVREWRVVTCSWLMKTSVTSRHKCCAVISNSKVCIWGETQVINQCQHPSEICTTKTGSYFHKIICTFASKLNTRRLPIALIAGHSKYLDLISFYREQKIGSDWLIDDWNSSRFCFFWLGWLVWKGAKTLNLR